MASVCPRGYSRLYRVLQTRVSGDDALCPAIIVEVSLELAFFVSGHHGYTERQRKSKGSPPAVIRQGVSLLRTLGFPSPHSRRWGTIGGILGAI